MTAAGEATRLRVAGPAAYDVLVGADVVSEVPALLGGAPTVALVHPAGLPGPADVVAATVAATGRSVTRLCVPDGEDAKELGIAATLWEGFARAGVTRQDAVVAVGGGATTDVAGFAAATWLRGVRLVLVPTTLLGMVDAAVGGKTAVNTAAGKNLVGAFHPPAGVVCDLRWLRTLPPAELASGLAEVVKTGFIADPVILDLLESPAPDEAVLRELVERSVRVKADVVARDLREAGPREVLNYGHTLGHAIERVESFRVRHGEAVSVGMVFAAELARLAGRLDEETVRRHREVLAAVGLPLTYRPQAWPHLLEAMRMDKKARGRRLRFVVLDGVGRPGILDDPDPALLDEAYRRVSS